MDLASVVAALASVGVRVSGSTPNNSIQGDSSRACPTGLAGPEPSGTHNDPGQHFHLLPPECLTDSQKPVRLKVANGQYMVGGTKEAAIGLQFVNHRELSRPDLGKEILLHGRFYEAEMDWDMIVGYDFMRETDSGVLPAQASMTLYQDDQLS